MKHDQHCEASETGCGCAQRAFLADATSGEIYEMQVALGRAPRLRTLLDPALTWGVR